MNGRLGFNVRMKSDNRIKCLFDYQRFEREPRLAALIEEVERRYALNEAGAFTLSDESLGALAAARGGPGVFFCPECGAAFSTEEALAQHKARAYRTE